MKETCDDTKLHFVEPIAVSAANPSIIKGILQETSDDGSKVLLCLETPSMATIDNFPIASL